MHHAIKAKVDYWRNNKDLITNMQWKLNRGGWHSHGIEIGGLNKYEDERGYQISVYNSDDEPLRYVEDRTTFSKKNVLRGFHGDWKTTKYITCVAGHLKLALVDVRPHTDNYLKWLLIDINAAVHPYQVTVPPGVVNAHYAVEDCVLYYKWTHPYDLDAQFTLYWNQFNIPWGIDSPILSERDNLGSKAGIFYDLPNQASSSIS